MVFFLIVHVRAYLPSRILVPTQEDFERVQKHDRPPNLIRLLQRYVECSQRAFPLLNYRRFFELLGPNEIFQDFTNFLGNLDPALCDFVTADEYVLPLAVPSLSLISISPKKTCSFICTYPSIQKKTNANAIAIASCQPLPSIVLQRNRA